MTTPIVLRISEDRLPASGDPAYLPALERALYVIEGDVTVEFIEGSVNQAAGSAWLGAAAVGLSAGAGGARLLRWEIDAPAAASGGALRAAPSAASAPKLAVEVELDERFDWLMRCDRVGFPRGAVAYSHVHQGPGIRYCLAGGIDIEAEGTRHRYAPGEPWFELGSAPVLATTSTETETEFVRCFVLPRGCKGRSSIRYVRPEDAAKPKLQKYKVLGERFIEIKNG
jgi:hypothetical protein